MQRDGVFAVLADERRRLADDLDSLSDAQWHTPSLCVGWRVREVVAHLDMPFSLSTPGFMFRFVAHGFNFNKLADRWAKRESRSNAELALELRNNAESEWTPPGAGPEAPLTDTVVHGQDIRRPLGLDHGVRAEHADLVLGTLSAKAAEAIRPKGLLDGLSFLSTNSEWRHGKGPEVRGPSEALILTLAGRSGALDELTGQGSSLVRERFAG